MPNKELIGVEIFDNVDAVLASALDVSPVAASMQAKVRDVAQQVRTPRRPAPALGPSEIVNPTTSSGVSTLGMMANPC